MHSARTITCSTESMSSEMSREAVRRRVQATAASTTCGDLKTESDTSQFHSNSSTSSAPLKPPSDSTSTSHADVSTHQPPSELRKVVVVSGPTSWFPYSPERPWLTYPMEVNILWWIVVVAAFVTRFWRIDFPRYVMFDEVHFGKFASYYLTRTFFFDVHPPLGKLIFAAVGYLNGFDGSFLFPTIGVEFPQVVPYVFMRSMSALTGALLVPCVYEIMMELGFSHRAAFLASIFTVLDNSLVIQSRVIMLDSFVIFLTYLSILCYLKFYHRRQQPFSPSWHLWLAYTGISLGCLLGVKYTGLLGLGCVGLLTICDLWQLVSDPTLDLLDLTLHTLLRGLYLLGIPMVTNFVLFYIHFAILTQSGPGNAYVSKAFQNSLEGSLASPAAVELSPNATLLRYGSMFSLRSSDISCWLHSHEQLYPLKYPDGRGSSYQQQVTCYEFRDPNNLWIVRKPGNPDNSSVNSDYDVIRNKDIVQLVHLATKKLLNSHDVAAPLTPTNQEVAGYINYSAQFVPYLGWRLEVLGLLEGDPVYWEPGRLKVRLFHVHSKQALASTGKRLPEWGYQQYEVVTDRAVEGSQVWWVMEELKAPAAMSKNTTREKEEEELKKLTKERREKMEVNNSTTTLSFLEKYVEMQHHMITAHGNLGDHQFGALPHSWPMMGKTLPYWLDERSNAQVTLLGNPLLWQISTTAIFIFLALVAFYLSRRKRQFFDLSTVADFRHLWTSGSVLLVGWLAHYLPYFLLSRVLFLHHYLPALPFKLMLLAAVCDHGHTLAKKWSKVLLPLYYLSLVAVCAIVMVSFFLFAPFTYGYPALTREQINWRHWSVSWDLLHR